MPEEHTTDERKDAAADFGFQISVLRSDPGLRKAFEAALDGGWTPQRFIAEVRNTGWFQKHGEAWRKSEILRISEPTTYKDDLIKAKAAMRDSAASMGAVLTPKQLDQFALNGYRFGWTPSQQRDALSTYVKVASGGEMKGQYIGDAGKNASALRAAAVRNGYKIPKGKLAEWNKAIMAGNSSVEDYQGFIRRQAAAAFPTFADELLAGADLDDLASPYRSSMARLLELNENEITLFDPKIRKALASKDVKTGKPTATPIYAFEDELRADPRWMKTSNAHEEILGKGRQVLTQMGLAL